MKLDAAAVHADPEGGIRWDLHTGEVVRADPVISVSYREFWRLHDATCDGWHPLDGDPAVTTTAPAMLPGAVTRWTFTNATYLYRVDSYDPDSDCYLLVWPD